MESTVRRWRLQLPHGLQVRGQLLGTVYRIEVYSAQPGVEVVLRTADLSLLGDAATVDRRLDAVLESLVQAAQRMELLGVVPSWQRPTVPESKTMAARAEQLSEALISDALIRT